MRLLVQTVVLDGCRQPGITVGAKSLDQRQRRLTLWRQAVFDPGRDRREDLTIENALSFELLQASAEHARTHPGRLLKLAESLRATRQVTQNQESPGVTKKSSSASDWTDRTAIAHSHSHRHDATSSPCHRKYTRYGVVSQAPGRDGVKKSAPADRPSSSRHE